MRGTPPKSRPEKGTFSAILVEKGGFWDTPKWTFSGKGCKNAGTLRVLYLVTHFWTPFFDIFVDGSRRWQSTSTRQWTIGGYRHLVKRVILRVPKGVLWPFWDPQNGHFRGPKMTLLALYAPVEAYPKRGVYPKTGHGFGPFLDTFWTLFGPFLALFSPFSPYGTPLGHLPLYCPLIWTLLGTLPGPQKGGPKTAIWDPFLGVWAHMAIYDV